MAIIITLLLSLNSTQFVSSTIITIPPPTITDGEGNLLDVPTVGKQVTISRSFTANIESSRQFLALFEIRNSDGVSVYIAWQTGIIYPKDDVVVGVSWMPEEAGDYDVRTFLLSNLTQPEVLSVVGSHDLKVIDA